MLQHLLFIVFCLVNCLSYNQVHSVSFEKTHIFKPYIRPPVLKPFVSVWNIESGPCETKYGVKISLDSFDIIYNKNESRNGDKMVIFYADRLGLYPYLNSQGQAINGGIPQLGNLSLHLAKCIDDIDKNLSNNFSGLSVIDWEPWTYTWNNMGWGERKQYQLASIAKVKYEHPYWPESLILAQAIKEYETAAKNFFLETLKLCKKLRPNAYWGFYLYPDCYNYDKTGQSLSCPQRQILIDDQIHQLFDTSTALYPSTYLGIWFKNQYNAIKYTANRIKEAQRVDKNRPGNVSIPIYAYNNLVYRKTNEFLTLQDLISTSGIAAFLGASGSVLWASDVHSSKDSCLRLSSYVDNTLGPFFELISSAFADCSAWLCNNNGRCIFDKKFNKNVDMKLPTSMSSFLGMIFRDKKRFFILS